MIQRKTQSREFWQDEFEFKGDDLTLIYDLILEAGTPIGTGKLALAIVDRHCRLEEARIQSEMSRGLAYQPKDEYEVGEQIIFPALGFSLATVVGKRSGVNPEHGEFAVIEVRFDADGATREFASELEGDHPLNRGTGGADPFAAGELLSPEELYDASRAELDDELVSFLKDRGEFVEFGDRWFLVELLVDINDGQLNIAEALIEIKAMPLSTAGLSDELELPTEVVEEIRHLSLSRALDTDARFDNVGDSDRAVWYLRRLAPSLVADLPERLALQPDVYERRSIGQELLAIESDLDDEGIGEAEKGPSRPLYRTRIALTYPHWRFGTLPLTKRTRGLFPSATTHHSPIVLVDARGGQRMQGWVVHGASLVYGLGEWYERHKLPAGAIVKLERTRNPRVVVLDFESQRLKRVWVTYVAVTSGDLVFQMRKSPIACEFDEQLALGEDDREQIDRLLAERRPKTLYRTMLDLMPELIKLSPQNTVHAKTVYNAVNVLRRTAPGPIFGLLSTEPCFVAMGGGYWTFDESLV